MQIKIIDYALVAADYKEVKEVQDTSHPTSRSQRFNTAHHTRLDILAVVPESATFTHAEPPWTAYGYALWQPLIARSQVMTESHVIQIPGFLYEDLMRCHAAWVSTNRVPQKLVQETVEAWKSTRRGLQPMELLDGKKKWFIRLDQMSPKDSPFGGKEPSSTFEDVVVKLCSSMRACRCLEFEKQDSERKDRGLNILLVLNAWDEGMDAGAEFRVFVPPPAARGAKAEASKLKVSAVSQYRWHSPFAYPHGFNLDEIAKLVCVGATKILEDTKAFMREELLEDTSFLLVKHGFSFDVALQKDGSVQLVEINPFGALSGCGACLLNWVKDGRAMYGLDEDVVFAVTLDENKRSGQEGTSVVEQLEGSGQEAVTDG